MAVSRSHTYIVTMRFPLPGNDHVDRRIAENALTAASAKNKVEAHYKKKGWKFTVVSVVRK